MNATSPVTLTTQPQLLPPMATCTVAVIGLGYVGLPLAVEFAKPQSCLRTGVALIRRVIGFDINQQRLRELGAGHDCNKETSPKELEAAIHLELTGDHEQLVGADLSLIHI